jgi:hypothetical protein
MSFTGRDGLIIADPPANFFEISISFPISATHLLPDRGLFLGAQVSENDLIVYMTKPCYNKFTTLLILKVKIRNYSASQEKRLVLVLFGVRSIPNKTNTPPTYPQAEQLQK